jgi:hypothetical protein
MIPGAFGDVLTVAFACRRQVFLLVSLRRTSGFVVMVDTLDGLSEPVRQTPHDAGRPSRDFCAPVTKTRQQDAGECEPRGQPDWDALGRLRTSASHSDEDPGRHPNDHSRNWNQNSEHGT